MIAPPTTLKSGETIQRRARLSQEAPLRWSRPAIGTRKFSEELGAADDQEDEGGAEGDRAAEVRHVPVELVGQQMRHERERRNAGDDVEAGGQGGRDELGQRALEPARALLLRPLVHLLRLGNLAQRRCSRAKRMNPSWSGPIWCT
jgi:hypothetical protein